MTELVAARPGRLPAGFWVMLLAVLIVGGVAGRLTQPVFQWTSPLMAVLLYLAARSDQRRRSRDVFPEAVARVCAETLVRLPDGVARALFERLVQAAQQVHLALGRAPLGGAQQRDVEQLVAHACRAALDLSDLEENTTDRGTASRDALARRFVRGIDVLHRLRVELVAAEPWQAEWQELVGSLDEEARAWAAARAEVEAALAGRT
jgi:hypothetical protein